MGQTGVPWPTTATCVDDARRRAALRARRDRVRAGALERRALRPRRVGDRAARRRGRLLPDVDRRGAGVRARSRARHGRPFVPRGSGTGLAGGAVPRRRRRSSSSPRKMNRDPRRSTPTSGSRGSSPACSTSTSPGAVAPLGLHFAPDPSSQQACTIGGNVATNSGGPHCLAYGVTSAHVLASRSCCPTARSRCSAGSTPSRPATTCGARSSAARARSASPPGSRCGSRPIPPAVRTLLLDFDVGRRRRRDGQRHHRRRARARRARDDGRARSPRRSRTSCTPASRPTRPPCCSSRSTGSPAASAADGRRVADDRPRATARRTVRVAADEAERALLWKGRKSAFGAIARIAPNYYLHDTVVPRTPARRGAARRSTRSPSATTCS